MPLRYSLFLLLTLGLCSAARAQQPFARFGVKVEVLSLSNGKYPEFFPNDSLRRVGSVVYNRRLHRIAYLLPPDSLLGRAKSEVTSRFWVVDPHAANYVNISPYAYVANNPVNNTDPDGRDIIYKTSTAFNRNTGVTTITVTANVTAKILNNSNLDQSAFNSRVSDFKSSLASSFTGNYTDPNNKKVNFVFQAGTIDVQGVSSMDKVKGSDNLLVMVDDVTGNTETGGGRAGVSKMGGRIGYVEPSSNGEFDSDLMVHEFGHQMGLEHNWEAGATREDKASGNYMSYESKRGGFSGHQLYQSFRASRNQGSNSSSAVDPYGQKRTTQSHPYKEAKNGDKIPAPLP
jgi:hypothetical protein